MPEEIVHIKRYPNRRFYDRSASKYISLEEIESLVHRGKKVEIRDSQTGEEITRSVLTRIILERQPDKMLLFPTDMLHFILQANEVSTSFLRDYFQHSLTYLEYLSRHGSAASTFARPMHWAKAWLDGIAPQKSQGDEPPPRTEVEGEDEATRLARRITQLEERIEQLESQEE
ncbi:MAG: polyhydroxyalkanoate synthesis regulator DNA-binding domain-containing protein [Pirellulales bacterium]|nr:polyhydroxyalkanoate synthesis regulator DNA-binding domain-containing protein [Pirellulales bacterium]